MRYYYIVAHDPAPGRQLVGAVILSTFPIFPVGPSEDVGLGRSPAPRYPLECVDPVTRAKLERVLPEAARSRLAQVARSGVWDTQRKTMVSNIRKMRDAGIPIAMGRESDLGSVDQGKHADLTIFDADPGANIRNARTVVMVMRGGILYSRRALLPTHQ